MLFLCVSLLAFAIFSKPDCFWFISLYIFFIFYFFARRWQLVYWEIEQRKMCLRLHLGKFVLCSARFSKAINAVCQLQTRNITKDRNKQMHYASTLSSADSNHRFSLDCRGDTVKRCTYLFQMPKNISAKASALWQM